VIQPYAAICHIRCQWADGTVATGSGVLVGANDVLTAHHVIFNADADGYATRITVTPGADTLPTWVAPFGSYSNVGSVQARTSNWDTNYNNLISDSEAQYDMALLGMTTALGSTTGWVTPSAYRSDFFGEMAGYPGRGTGLMGEIVYADASSFFGVYDIYSALGPGASGGPLLRETPTGTQVVGVLSSGNAADTASTYAGLFGPGNMAWLDAAMSNNDSVLGYTGAMQTPVIPDDYAGSLATQGTLSVGASRSGTLETSLDADWFRVTLNAGTYRFDAKAITSLAGSLLDPYATLYNSTGSALTSNDDGGTGLDAQITWTITTGGTYYLGVRSAYGFSESAGTYSVSATLVSAASGSGGSIPAPGALAPTLTGTASVDALTGTSGNDVIWGKGGNDLINGGGGTDTAYYTGNRSEYNLANWGAVVTVTDRLGLDGIDALTDMERIAFRDMTVNLQIGAKARTITQPQLKQLQELYVAFFNRIPDADGLSYWIDQVRAGQSISSIASAFYSAALQYPTQTGYSSAMSNADFIHIVYRNVLGRTDGADADGLAYWTSALGSGAQSRGGLVTSILATAHTFKGHATYGYVADLLDNKAAVAQKFAVDMGLNYNSAEASISNGMAIAGAVTYHSIAAAVTLIGVPDGFVTFG
jgi:V8-like Glu-specific endopeptidase